VNLRPPADLLANQMREVLYEGQLLLTEREKTTDVYMILLTDLILVTKVKKDGKKLKTGVSAMRCSWHKYTDTIGQGGW